MKCHKNILICFVFIRITSASGDARYASQISSRSPRKVGIRLNVIATSAHHQPKSLRYRPSTTFSLSSHGTPTQKTGFYAIPEVANASGSIYHLTTNCGNSSRNRLSRTLKIWKIGRMVSRFVMIVRTIKNKYILI